MLLRSPQNLHYPITVTELLRKANDRVGRNEALFSYSWKSFVTEGNKYGDQKRVEKTFPAKLTSEFEGSVLRWKVAPGTVIDKAGVELAEVEEPCKHDVQFGGLCVVCGKDMTEVDYGTTIPDSNRANVNQIPYEKETMLRISQDEAYRIELIKKRQLLQDKKLSLVVDLDQTIIHATVDPTVGEWMNDSENPNHEAVKDVHKFQLLEHGATAGNWYYVKMRPGLKRFLENISQLYELHIYTMGTRAYALNIAAIVDPDKTLFGSRILSRDENNDESVKSLNKLFPVDTKMVAIIDDRGDVWNWSPNLLRVTPYDFFRGIGDINASFLPKRADVIIPDESTPIIRPPLATTETKASDAPAQDSETSNVKKATEELNEETSQVVTIEPSIVEKLVAMSGSSDMVAMKEKTAEQDEQLKAQIADRPLLQEQIKLEQAGVQAAEEAAASREASQRNGGSVSEATAEAPQPRQNLLTDDDDELGFLEQHLRVVHASFYDEYYEHKEKFKRTLGGGRVAELKGEKSPRKKPEVDEFNLSLVPDVQEIIPRIKMKVLGDAVLTFSGLMPLNVTPATSDTGRWAASFGASFSGEVTKQTTHVVGVRNHNTAKLKVAARHPRIKIVTLPWLLKVLKEWNRADETPYVIDVAPVPCKKRKRVQNIDSSDEEDYAPPMDQGDRDTDVPLTAYGRPDESFTDDEDDIDAESITSPVDDIDEDDWDKMGEDFDDTEFDTSESETDAENGEMNKKRKRTTDSGDSEESEASMATPGSELQKRKRRALDRTSSLNRVTTLQQVEAEEAISRGAPEEMSLDSALANGLADDDDDESDDGLEEFLKQQLEDEDDD